MSSADGSTTKPLVLVVGASGRLGRVLIEELLAHGHRARAFSRHATALSAREGLERIDGSVLDHLAVDRAVMGVQAVVCAIGPTSSRDLDLCTLGTERLTRAMRDHHVRRLVCVTGAMIGHPPELLGRVYRWLARMTPAAAMADRRKQETVVRESELEWTLVRPTRLTDGPLDARVRAGDDFRIGARAHVSRRSVARFIADCLGRPDTIARAYALSEH